MGPRQANQSPEDSPTLLSFTPSQQGQGWIRQNLMAAESGRSQRGAQLDSCWGGVWGGLLGWGGVALQYLLRFGLGIRAG